MKESEVKQCLNERCPNKGQCVHGIMRKRIIEQLGRDYAKDPILCNMFPAIYPCGAVCKRYINDKID